MIDDRSPEKEPPHAYECMVCGYRVTSKRKPGVCPECGGEMQNLSKPRT